MWLEITVGLILLFLQLCGIAIAFVTIAMSMWQADYNTRAIMFAILITTTVLPLMVAYLMGSINNVSIDIKSN